MAVNLDRSLGKVVLFLLSVIRITVRLGVVIVVVVVIVADVPLGTLRSSCRRLGRVCVRRIISPRVPSIELRRGERGSEKRENRHTFRI